MIPGSLLDERIEREFLGSRAQNVPLYSRLLQPAWHLVEELACRGFNVHVSLYGQTKEYQACLEKQDFSPIYLMGKSIPHAICLAALESLKKRKVRPYGRHPDDSPRPLNSGQDLTSEYRGGWLDDFGIPKSVFNPEP